MRDGWYAVDAPAENSFQMALDPGSSMGSSWPALRRAVTCLVCIVMYSSLCPIVMIESYAISTTQKDRYCIQCTQ